MKLEWSGIGRHLLLGLLLAPLAGCSPDLGAIPFFCNKGYPKCPDGYTCTDNYCHREDECPEVIPGCQGKRTADGGPADTLRSDTLRSDTRLPDWGPMTLPRGKFCNDLEKTGGIKFTFVLTIASVTLSALTGTCSPCVNLPAGQSQVTLTEQGKPTPDLTGTATLDSGKEYIFISELDSSNDLTLAGGSLKPGYRCETVDPFNP
jgi:hypothetical protein